MIAETSPCKSFSKSYEDTGSLRCFPAFVYGPGPDFLHTGGEIGIQLQQFVGRRINCSMQLRHFIFVHKKLRSPHFPFRQSVLLLNIHHNYPCISGCHGRFQRIWYLLPVCIKLINIATYKTGLFVSSIRSAIAFFLLCPCLVPGYCGPGPGVVCSVSALIFLALFGSAVFNNFPLLIIFVNTSKSLLQFGSIISFIAYG